MRAALLGAVVLVAACNTGARQEAAQVAEGMDRFRQADNVAKPAKVEALRSVKCSVTDVCRARDACLASAEATAKALRLKSEVAQGLSAVERGAVLMDTAEARALAPKLDEAEALLNEGFKALPECDDQILALRRKYGF